MEFIKWFSKTNIKNKNVGFEDIKYAINKPQYMIINTMSSIEQDCLIYGTIPFDKEESIINNIIENMPGDIGTMIIIIYGKHSTDETPEKKYNQLIQYGFKEVYIYTGGLFEWLLLQDIYGKSNFPTTSDARDLLKYRPQMVIPKYHIPRIL
jgi:hypothetical protein